MNNDFYKTIFKRKSFHLFRGVGSDRISETELADIGEAFTAFESLYPDIRTAIRIVPTEKVNFKRDAEYCILIYSEKKENYLMNAGYLGEQLDLWLVNRNIGTLWYGIGRPDEENYQELEFVIMIAVHKVKNETLYRRDLFKAKRKPLDEIWAGDTMGVGEIARFAPSACNSQPWYVNNSGGTLTVHRYKKQSRVGIMPPAKASYFNRIDIGIFLCILEICMAENGVLFERQLFADSGDEEYTKVAEYKK